MKKVILFSTLCLLNFIAICQTKTSSEKEFVKQKRKCNWEHSVFIDKSEFSSAVAGDKLTLQFSSAADYSRLFLFYESNSQWKNYLFSNVTCTPEPYYLKQEQTDASTNKKYEITKIAPANSTDVYTVTVTLNKQEAVLLKQHGLIVTGQDFFLYSCKYIPLTKKKKSKTVTLEEYYEETATSRNHMLSSYSAKYITPIISITTEKGQPVKKKDYYASIIDVLNCESQFVLSKKGKVKVRGNSTADDKWSPDNKPYRIKFDEKQTMLGLHKGKTYKNWVLLKADGYNPSDYLGFKLANEIYKTSRYKYYASDCTFVHVIINEKYMGVYLLCEQNQVSKGRVNVHEPDAKNKSTEIGYMLELDNYAWDDLSNGGRYFGKDCMKGEEDYHFEVSYLSENKSENVTMRVWGSSQDGVKIKDVNGVERGAQKDVFTIKSKITSDDQVIFIQKYMTGLWNICYKAIEKNQFYKFNKNYDLVPAPEFKSAEETCAAVMDLESLCNEMILEELVRDNDVGCGSLYMAIDFTRAPGEKYNKFTFECPWDFNWAYSPIKNDLDGGKFWDGKIQYFAGAWQTMHMLEGYEADRSHPWFVLFNNAPWFRDMLRSKWNQIGIDNLKAVTTEVDSVVKKYGKDTGGADAKWITDFVRDRIDYIEMNCWK